MTQINPFRYFKTSPEIIRLAVMMYVRFPLSLRNVEDLLHESGIDISHETIVTDKPKSYGAALRELGVSGHENNGRWINNRAENSHLPFRRRKRAMQRFRRMRSLLKFTSIHSSVYNHFNKERNQYSRHNFKENRTVALNEWRQILAA